MHGASYSDEQAELERHLAFLAVLEVESKDHSFRSLLDHLKGTRDILRRWRLSEPVCAAGLFHSIYGTEVYRSVTAPMSLREQVQAHIGPEAEEIVWLFCVMHRPSLEANLTSQGPYFVLTHEGKERVALSRQRFIDLVHLSIANTLEQLPHLPVEYRAMGQPLLRYRGVATAQAIEELEAYLGGSANAE